MEDFKRYIGELTVYNSDTVLFCSENEEYIGTLFPNITDKSGVRISIPIIYLFKKICTEERMVYFKFYRVYFSKMRG